MDGFQGFGDTPDGIITPDVLRPVSVLRRLLPLLGLAALQMVLLTSVWPGFLSPNEFSRIEAAHAMVMRGTWCVDREVERYGAIDDLSRAPDGRLYSNKAPGLIWAAVPVVAALHLVAPEAGIGAELLTARLVLVSGAALLAALVLGLWGERLGARDRVVPVTFVLLFATPFAVYDATFFSHAWTGSLLLAASWLLLGPKKPSLAGDIVGGALLALAVVSEYPAAVVAGPFALAAVWGRWRRLLPVTLGTIPPLAGLAAYNLACFGDPFLLGSRLEAFPRYAALAADPTFGFTVPRPGGLAGLLISPLAGLLLFAPVLVPALAAPVLAYRRGERRLAVALAAAAWLLPLVMAGYREWPGGASFGPRYLVLGLPVLVLGLVLSPAGERWRVWVAGAGVASAVVALLGRLTPPFAIDGPWFSSTLRGWTVPALTGGLWNPPLTGGPPAAPLVLAAVAAVWVAAGWVALAPLRLGRTRVLAAAALAMALLAVQFGAGRVTVRQQRWFERMAPAFRIAPPVAPGD